METSPYCFFFSISIYHHRYHFVFFAFPLFHLQFTLPIWLVQILIKACQLAIDLVLESNPCQT